jgi:hypothetical protein
VPVNQCRVCGQAFFEVPLLSYCNMPRAAQCMPDAGSLGQDRGVDLNVCQCSGCGLVQLEGDPVPYYREVIRAAAFSPEMMEFRQTQFRRFMEKFSLRGQKIIEIGCGRGEYLSILQQCGMESHGLEQSAEAVAFCVRSGLRTSQGFVQSNRYRLDGAPFEAFFILNFLEHLPDPITTLRGIRGNLRDEAVGLVEVPNFDMILQNALFAEFIADHLLYFTGETLQTALRLGGFDVLDCNAERQEYILSATVRKTGRMDLSRFQTRQMKLQEELDGYVSRFPSRRVAIWGASHQALAIISLASLGDRIRYVVDSAPFKQGKFTPASHLRIVPPSELRTDPVDAVIVMAASYSDEVVRILRRDFDPRLNLAILRESGLEIVREPETP